MRGRQDGRKEGKDMKEGFRDWKGRERKGRNRRVKNDGRQGRKRLKEKTREEEGGKEMKEVFRR